MDKKFAIVSCKGGVGKSIAAINLCAAAYSLGLETIMIDADISASTLGIQLNIYSSQHSLQDVLLDRVGVEEAVYKHSTGLKVIPNSLALGQADVKTHNLNEKIRGLKGMVFIDASSGIREDVKNVIDACDEVLVVTNPEEAAIAGALKVIRVIKKREKSISGIIVNRVREGLEFPLDAIQKVCGVPVIAVIPEDNNVQRSLNEKIPLVFYRQYSPASIAFKKLAAELAGLKYRKPKFLFLKRLFE